MISLCPQSLQLMNIIIWYHANHPSVWNFLTISFIKQLHGVSLNQQTFNAKSEHFFGGVMHLYSVMCSACVNVLQITTSLLSFHPLQDIRATSLECAAQRFHSASATTLQPGMDWRYYVRNGSVEVKLKRQRRQYAELSSMIVDTLYQPCEQQVSKTV